MKTTTKLIFLLTFIFISCKDASENPLQKSVIEKVKKTLVNPDSFEFVSYEIYQQMSVSEIKEMYKNTNEDFLKQIEQVYGKDSRDYFEYEQVINFLKNQKDNDKIGMYYVKLVYKGTNIYGGIIQSTFNERILNDKNFTILDNSYEKQRIEPEAEAIVE
jgi:hypothetical protein